MNRRDFLASIATAYGVAVLPPIRVTPAGEPDHVAAAEAAAESPVEIMVPVALLGERGEELLTRLVRFQASEEWVDDRQVVVFRATEDAVWKAVPAPLVAHQIVARFPVGAITHQVVFPTGNQLPLYANGGDINVRGLRAVLS